MEDHYGTLYYIALRYPKRLFERFFKREIRSNCWSNILEITNNDFSFGTESSNFCFKISYSTPNTFQIKVPANNIRLNEEEIENDFSNFLKEEKLDVFFYQQIGDKKSRLEQRIPLGEKTKKIKKWMLIMEEKLGKDIFSIDRIDVTDRYPDEHSLVYKVEKEEIEIYHKNKKVSCIKNDEELEHFIFEVEKIRKKVVEIRELACHYQTMVDSETTSKLQFMRKYGVEYYPRIGIEHHTLENYSLQLHVQNKIFSFVPNKNILEQFPEKQILNIYKGAKLKKLFEIEKERV